MWLNARLRQSRVLRVGMGETWCSWLESREGGGGKGRSRKHWTETYHQVNCHRLGQALVRPTLSLRLGLVLAVSTALEVATEVSLQGPSLLVPMVPRQARLNQVQALECPGHCWASRMA